MNISDMAIDKIIYKKFDSSRTASELATIVAESGTATEPEVGDTLLDAVLKVGGSIDVSIWALGVTSARISVQVYKNGTEVGSVINATYNNSPQGITVNISPLDRITIKKASSTAAGDYNVACKGDLIDDISQYYTNNLT